MRERPASRDGYRVSPGPSVVGASAFGNFGEMFVHGSVTDFIPLVLSGWYASPADYAMFIGLPKGVAGAVKQFVVLRRAPPR